MTSIRARIGPIPVALAAIALAATVSSAQQSTSTMAGSVNEMQTEMHVLTDVQKQGGASNPEEVKAYKAFYSTNEPNKKVQLGNSFLQKYPKSPLDEPVEVGLLNVYYSKQDWINVYAAADSALALKPDDVYVLTTVGWVIPHVYHPDDPDADQLLDKAETYSKHAIEVIPTMPKPSYMSDAQFAAMKTQSALQAHSALGLVYFRRGDYENSVKELQQSTPGTATPDQIDLYILGVDFENLKRFADAVDAYNRCGQIAGPLQDNCKQSADAAKKQVAQSK